ncbi:MAG: oligosaccharide flippase family protein [Desulfobulbaceae bacterium]|nr:oligosaccharide flippase family protein [Desulfobulbaceae bacterium]
MPLAAFTRKLQALTADEKFSEILTGSAWALAGQILASGLGLLLSVSIARIHGAGVMGTVAVINALLTLTTIFTVLGTDTVILRLLPEHLLRYSAASARRVYRQAGWLVSGASLAVGLLLFLASGPLAQQVFRKPQLGYYLALTAPFLLVSSLKTLNTQAVRGLRLLRLYALMLLTPALSNLLLLLGLNRFCFSPDNPIYSLLAALVCTALLGGLLVQREFRRRLTREDRVQALSARAILSLSLPMLTTSALFFFTAQTGVIILGIFRPEAQVAYYDVAVKLSLLVGFVLTAVNAMAAPRFAELFHADKIDELFYVARKSAKLIFWLTTPILLTLVLLGRPLLQLLFGPEFVQAYPALLLLMAGQFVNAASGSTGFFMNMTGHQNLLRNCTAITALLNIGLSLALIPSFGIAGAAFAAMVGISLLNVLLLLYIKRKYGRSTGYLPFLPS